MRRRAMLINGNRWDLALSEVLNHGLVVRAFATDESAWQEALPPSLCQAFYCDCLSELQNWISAVVSLVLGTKSCGCQTKDKPMYIVSIYKLFPQQYFLNLCHIIFLCSSKVLAHDQMTVETGNIHKLQKQSNLLRKYHLLEEKGVFFLSVNLFVYIL